MTAHLARYLVGEALGDRRVEHLRQAILCIDCGAPDQQPGRFHFHLHLGEPQLHRLELDERFAELLALLHVGDDVFERAAGLRESHGRIPAAFQVERFHQVAEAASRHDDVFDGHCAVVEVQVAARHTVKAHQALRAAKAQSRRVAFYVDCSDAFRTRLRAQAAVNDVSISVSSAGTPALRAVDHDTVPANFRARRQIGERRARRRLGHRHRHDQLAAADARHDSQSQGFSGEALDRAHGPHAGFEDRKGQCRGALAEFLQHQQGFETAQAESAVTGVDVDAEKSHLGIFADELVRRRHTGTLGLGCERHQPFAHVLARRRLQGELLVIESKVHGCSCADEVVPWR